MRNVNNPIELINSIMSENDKLLFNLFYLIADSDDSFWMTDDKSYIIGQSNEKRPMWLWMADNIDTDAMNEIEDIIEERLNLNSPLKVTADGNKIEDILKSLTERNIRHELSTPMVAYYCDKVEKAKNNLGQVILSSEYHKSILEKFITEMVYDLAKRPMEPGEAEGFAEAVAGSPDLYLCEDKGEVVSMAMIAHRAEKYARINTVYTDNNQRGKGYAGVLMADITQKILDEGRVPMLYTETDNVCSNALYKKVGYKVCGELEEYLLYRQ